MRKRDLHILTSNIHTYTGDGRFSITHPENSDEWNLKIDYVQRRDAGIYECQVNTEPKINMAILLNVEGKRIKCLLSIRFSKFPVYTSVLSYTLFCVHKIITIANVYNFIFFFCNLYIL